MEGDKGNCMVVVRIRLVLEWVFSIVGWFENISGFE